MGRPKAQFCPHGHDTHVVGRAVGGGCRECCKAATVRWRERNIDRKRATVRLCNRRKSGVVGATAEQRGGPCEICGKVLDKLHLDHDHDTGAIRGWLCPSCNTLLGHYEKMHRDNWKQRAEQYLQKDYSNARFG